MVLTLLHSIASLCQGEFCRNVYLWDFETVRKEKNDITEQLTNEVEDAFSQISSCKILQRRRYAELEEHRVNEEGIMDVQGLSSKVKEELQTIRAEMVLFGEIEQDFSFNIKLRLRLQILATSQILRTISGVIKGSEMINVEKRKGAIQRIVNELLNINSNSQGKSGATSKSRLPNGIYIFLNNYQKYNLEIQNNFWGIPAVRVTKVELNGKTLTFYYDYLNGRAEGIVNEDGILQGEYSNKWGGGTFKMNFHADGTSRGNWKSQDLIKKGGEFNLILKDK